MLIQSSAIHCIDQGFDDYFLTHFMNSSEKSIGLELPKIAITLNGTISTLDICGQGSSDFTDSAQFLSKLELMQSLLHQTRSSKQYLFFESAV